MYHMCIISDPYVSLYGWLVNGRKGGKERGKGKRIEVQLPGFDAWLPCLTVI